MIKGIIMRKLALPSFPMPPPAIVPLASAGLPALITGAGPRARQRYVEFFAANIRNANTRRAYLGAVERFTAWCARHDLDDLAALQPVHIGTYIEALQRELAAPSVKQHLAALRSLLDYLATGGVLPFNPAAAVRGPKYSVRRGKTPVLTAEETRTLLDSIPAVVGGRHDGQALRDARDRALIGLMVFTFARVGAALAMRCDDYFAQGRRMWIRLNEKGGKQHTMPAHHSLESLMDEYIQLGHLAVTPAAPLFQSVSGWALSRRGFSQSNVWRMLRRRAAAAGIKTLIGSHTFRATGITTYLQNGGKLELAQQMANHESPRTTSLYDRRNDQLSLDEVERILI
jgi:site-specific recombinase XerD